MTLLEIAVLGSEGKLKKPTTVILDAVQDSATFYIIPMTFDIAADVAYLRNLRDPMDRAIVATARVHGLRLLTSDQRIIDSQMVAVVE